MIAVIADQLKQFRHRPKHVIFVGSGAILQPYEATVEELLQRMALEWAGERVADLPPDQRAGAALAMFAEQFPDGRERALRFAQRLAELRPGEGHVQLARLIKEGYVPLLFTMCPTDSLERALAAQRMVAGQDYHCVVAGVDAPQDIELAVRASRRFVIVKCGGDLQQRVLPLTSQEIVAHLEPIADLTRDAFRRLAILVAYADRDAPFLAYIPRDGDKVYWVTPYVPVADRKAVDDMRLVSPDAEQYHKLLPEVTSLLAARNSQRNLLCREQGHFNEFFGRLYERLRRTRSGARLPARRDLALLRGGPFKFLEAFDVHDADLFFGREKETDQLYELVTQHRLVTLFGCLGVGKTSLVRAGLMARLQRISREEADGEQVLPWLAAYAPIAAAPTAQLLGALAEQVEEAGYEGEPMASAPDLPTAARLCQDMTGRRLLLVADNAHELFLKVSQTVREEFVQQAAALINDPSLDARLLLVIREDYLGYLYELTDQLPTVMHHVLRLHRFTRVQAEDAILKPAANFQIHFDRDLAQQLIEDLDREGILPAHLQIVCHRLLEEAGVGRSYIGPALYRRLGGARKILDDYLSHALGQLSLTDRRLAWQILRTLTEVSETLAAVPHAEILDRLNTTAAALDRVLARLADLRLVRIFDQEGVRHVALIHDLLAADIRAAVAGRRLPPGVQSAHDILARGLDNFRVTGAVLERGETHAVNDERNELTLSTPELELAIRSAVYNDIAADYWLARLPELRERRYAILADLLSSEDERLRALGLKYARDNLGLPLVEPLLRLVQEKGPAAEQARELLRNMERELVAALTHGDAQQRRWAAMALAQANGRRHLRQLLAALDDGQLEAAEPIAEALANLDARRAARALLRLAVGPRAQWAHAVALGRLAQDRAVQALLQKATARHPASPLLAYAFGLALMRQRRYAEALEILQRAATLAASENLAAEPLRAALKRCQEVLETAERGGGRWANSGGSPDHRGYVPATLAPPLREFWTATLAGEIAGGVVADLGLVFAAQRNGVLVALDLASGSLVWQRALGAPVEVMPCLADHLVLCATADRRLVGVSPQGEVAFTAPLRGVPRPPLTAAGRVVLIGDRAGRLTAFDLATRQPRWERAFREELTAPPTVAYDLVFAASWDASVAALSIHDGQEIWHHRGDSPVAGGVAVGEGLAVWGEDDGSLLAVRPLDGELVWQRRLPAGVRAAPAIAPTHLLVPCLDGVARAFHLQEASPAWEFATGDQLLAAPLVVGEVVYLASRDGCLYALALATGTELWRYPTSYGVYATPALVEGMLLAVLRQRQVVAFAPEEESG
jgi:outer membrane protein assembly factor BamB